MSKKKEQPKTILSIPIFDILIKVSVSLLDLKIYCLRESKL